jgi:hypothetical protein
MQDLSQLKWCAARCQQSAAGCLRPFRQRAALSAVSNHLSGGHALSCLHFGWMKLGRTSSFCNCSCAERACWYTPEWLILRLMLTRARVLQCLCEAAALHGTLLNALQRLCAWSPARVCVPDPPHQAVVPVLQQQAPAEQACSLAGLMSRRCASALCFTSRAWGVVMSVTARCLCVCVAVFGLPGRVTQMQRHASTECMNLSSPPVIRAIAPLLWDIAACPPLVTFVPKGGHAARSQRPSSTCG